MSSTAFVESLGLPEGSQTVPPQWGTFLAFDFGTKRTGVAFGTRLLGTANPIGLIAGQGKAQFPLAQAYISQWQPDALVVGIPFHPDGAEHDNTLLARKFMRSLHGRFGLAVFGVDERYSTTEALAGGAGESQVDAQSAAIILTQFLRNLP